MEGMRHKVLKLAESRVDYRLLFFLFLHSAGPLFVLFGPGTKKSQQERINWPTHYRSEQILDPSSHQICNSYIYSYTIMADPRLHISLPLNYITQY